MCLDEVHLVGWAVVEPSGTLIHLLVAGKYRGQGIGRKMMKLLSPKFVRSKSDQSSGNPESFYLSVGYRKLRSEQSRSRLDIDMLKPFRPRNIDVFVRRKC